MKIVEEQMTKETVNAQKKKKEPISQDQFLTSSLVSMLSLAMLAAFDSIMPSPVR